MEKKKTIMMFSLAEFVELLRLVAAARNTN